MTKGNLSALLKYLLILFAIMSVSACRCRNYNSVLKNQEFATSVGAKKIAVVLPASGITPEQIKELREILPINIKFDYTPLEERHPYHSVNDTTRYEMLKKAMVDNDVEIIWCIRGGYGSSKLLQKLLNIKKPQKVKTIIGYSDITALNIFISQKWGWRVIHGAMMFELLDSKKNQENFLQLIRILDNNTDITRITELKCINNKNNRCDKNIEGRITGGNLSTIITTLGTKWQIIAKDKILFLEDVSEKGYVIDRYLHHLHDAGILKDVKAVVFGEFTDQKDSLTDYTIEEFAKNVDFPVFQTKKIGHDKTNLPILYNARSVIKLEIMAGECEVSNGNVQHYSLIMRISS